MEAPGNRLPLTGLTLPQLTELLGSQTRALATLRWLHSGPRAPEALPGSIPGVCASAWATLLSRCQHVPPILSVRSVASDGTIKYALDFHGAKVETVLIPSARRSTVCVSSQSGCTRRCQFCATSLLGLTRNLTAAELVGQFLVARADAPAAAPLRNVVFMGMGEPMDNLDAVLTAVEILTQRPAPQLGARQITVSTSGVLTGMRRFLRECPAHLALSLNATTDVQRSALMPQNDEWPIAALLDTLRENARTSGRLFFIEYVLLEGFNDSLDDAQRLLELLRGIPARVNLIPQNPFEGSALRPPPAGQVARFQATLRAGGLRCLVRGPRGQEIHAACGQLTRQRRPDASGTLRSGSA